MNPASRLLAIVQHTPPQHQQQAMSGSWWSYLNLEPNGSNEVPSIAAMAAVSEVRSMEFRLRHLGVPEPLYYDCVSVLREWLSPANLNQHWSSYREQVRSKSVEIVLKWAAWSLTQFDEPDVDPDVMSRLQADVEAQEQRLADTALPYALREMLERQVADLKAALLLYRVKGMQPIVEAVNKSVGEVRNASEELVAECEVDKPGKAQEVFKKALELVTNAGRVADAGSKVVKFGADLWQLGTTVWPAINGPASS